MKTENENNSTSDASSVEASTSKSKNRNQGKKRKRSSSESSNDGDIILPDNALETEGNVHASAVKNNLDETSVRKIIKRVVTNDHVLALVKLREEEEDSSTDDKKLQPKLTRAKAKELKKSSPACKSAGWNLENLELTPINHIPVKTRPEVKALIAQELPEDEDDEEYQPTIDDVPSDDDHGESCSDLDSQPRTPATPASAPSDSPRMVKDGPFKVPLDVSTARRKLEIEEEEATIALRTRSKLSLSATSIEHIESTFIPPDDLPIQDVDNLWSEFLTECLNPASTTKHEDDDEADPEYNVAADPDAQDEDEESLSNSLIKISKKELNDLVTELFNIMPEAANEDFTENLANSVLTDTSQTELPRWEGKHEPLSDDKNRDRPSKRLKFEKQEYSRLPLDNNKTEKVKKCQNVQVNECEKEKEQGKKENAQLAEVVYKVQSTEQTSQFSSRPQLTICAKNNNIEISIEERSQPHPSNVPIAPASLRSKIKPASETVHIKIESTVTVTPEQLIILQQQIRQHVQLATSNFMQLVVHPLHWKMAPTYKEYLASLTKLVEDKESSVVNVCNLKPAYELVTTWEKSVSEDTAENRKMIEFIQGEVDRSRRRTASNSLYVGEFHDTFKKVVSTSPVFLYPCLLPAMPYRPDGTRRFCYLHSEDVLIVLGLDQFWQYVDSNPQLFKLQRIRNPRGRPGLMTAVELVTKHMFPWMTARTLAGHIHAVRSAKDTQNPIYRYFKYNELPKTEHRILPYNPKISLYEQPEHEMPKIWVRYLAKTSKRFRNYIHKRPSATGRQPDGVPINSGVITDTTLKRPLPIDYTKQVLYQALVNDKQQSTLTDKFDINIQRLDTPNQERNVSNVDKAVTEVIAQNPTLIAKNFYRLVETSTGAYLLPLQVENISTVQPITTPAEITTILANNLPETRPKTVIYNEHCTCCLLLRKICKEKQTLITDYFKNGSAVKKCDCSNVKYPKISNRLRLLVRNHKKMSELVFKDLEKILETDGRNDNKTEMQDCNSKEMSHVLAYQLKVFTQASMSKRIYVKKRVNNLLSRFDIESSDPIQLTTDLFKTFGVELVDLYLDFLGFLTPEQADKMELFRDYFTRNCAKDLMQRVEEEVCNKEARHKILTQLKSVFTVVSSSCEICTGLLKTMKEYPRLARYTFGLFPHRKETRTPQCTVVETPQSEEKKETNDTMCDGPHNTVDYEADLSSSGEDSDNMSVDLEPRPVEANPDAIKMEPIAEVQEETTEAIISKIETEAYDSDTSMLEADNIKLEIETSEWKRDEDKIILEVLKEHLSPEERKNKTILELLEEKDVYGLLSESLMDRSLFEIKERVLELLTVVVIPENDKT